MAGVVFHVVNRGSRRGVLFGTDAEFAAFEQVLIETLRRYPIALFEYALMRTHFHLVVRPRTERELPSFMHWLTSTHATRWRLATDTVGEGAVYQGRYRAVPVQTEAYFYTLARYVQRNPVRAGVVARAEEWRWGSLWLRERRDRRIRLAEWPLPRPQDWLTHVNSPQTASEIDAVRKSVNRSTPLGNSGWLQEVAKHSGIPGFPVQRGRPRQR